jgi:hypothetical protein
MAARRAVVDSSALKLVSCSRCDGLGKQDRNREQTGYSLQRHKVTSRRQPNASKQENPISEQELEQLKLVIDYVNFHMGLYLVTPSVLVLIATGLQVTNSNWWVGFLLLMILIYVVSGVHAGLFMGRFIDHEWKGSSRLKELKEEAYSLRRRGFHHWLYWAGLLVGTSGLIIALAEKLLIGQ